MRTLIKLNIAKEQISLQDEYDMTPIHLAAIVYVKEIFDELMQLGPNLYMKDSNGLTVIDYLSENEELDNVMLQEIKSKYQIQ